MTSRGELLSRREAAVRAGVHTNTVIAWERKGLINVRRVRVGSRDETMIPASEIDKVAGGSELAEAPRRRARPADDDAAPPSRHDRRAAERALRRERGALEHADRERAAREAAEQRIKELEAELRAERATHAHARHELDNARSELRAQQRSLERTLASAGRRARQLEDQARRDAEAAKRLRTDAEEYEERVRAEIRQQVDALRTDVAELRRREADTERVEAELEATRAAMAEHERTLTEQLEQERQARAEWEEWAYVAVEAARSEAAATVAEAMLDLERERQALRAGAPADRPPPADDGLEAFEIGPAVLDHRE